jgi:hypothetical protein
MVSYLLVNHTQKRIILVEEIEMMWKACIHLLKNVWRDTDTVEIMHEYDDYNKLCYLAKQENYQHDLGDVFR